jgi:hypothetical protein
MRRISRGLTAGRGGRIVYRTRRGRIRSLVVVSRRQAKRPASVRRRVRALGL